MVRTPDRVFVLAATVLGACAAPSRGPLKQVLGLDSYSSTCGKYPAQCAAAMGKETAAAGAASAAGVYQAARIASKVIDAALQERIDRVLSECADLARSEVLIKHGFKDVGPTAKDCDQQVDIGFRHEPITLAEQMGSEMHEVAEHCAEKRLNLFKPGGFRIEQRYRYDPNSAVVTPISKADADALVREGRATELRGTLVPDLVIHEDGDPGRVLDVYDFKFPCLPADEPSLWRYDPSEAPYSELNQGIRYRHAFKVEQPARVQPRIGVIRGAL